MITFFDNETKEPKESWTEYFSVPRQGELVMLADEKLYGVIAVVNHYEQIKIFVI